MRHTEIKNIRAISEYRANNLLYFGHFFKVVIWPISADGEFLKYRRNIGQIRLILGLTEMVLLV